MIVKKNIIGICGSASENSANLSILKWMSGLEETNFNLEIIDSLTDLPHFKTKLTEENTPNEIVILREKITKADGIIICTPEYIFSLPSGLKNMLEWCVSTTVFTDKPMILVTASTMGIKGHTELKLIMETIQGKFTNETTLLIEGVKEKVDKTGNILDKNIEIQLLKLIESFKGLLEL